MLLSFTNVHFTHDGSPDPVFEGLQFTLGRGWTGVVGANGAGKTTLLRLALGALTPTTGHVSAPGRGLYCPQRTDAEPAGLRDLLDAVDSRAQRLRQRLGMWPDWAVRWETLSHGERKRAQIGVVLYEDEDLVAVDEPTNHLDRATRDLVRDALRSFQGTGLLVSHDRDLLDDLCGQCLFLDPPRVTLRPGGYSEGARQVATERHARLRQLEQASREVDQLQKEYIRRREQAAMGERQRSKRGLARGDHDAKARVNAARLLDGKSGRRVRQLDGRIEHAADRRAGLRVRREFSLGISFGGERSARPLLLSLPEGEILLGDQRRLRIPSLVIRPRDRIGIRGLNGAGKSTLVRRIVSDLTRVGERVAYVPQEIEASRSRGLLDTFRMLPPDRLGRAMTLVRRLGSDPARLLQSAEPSPGELRKLLLASCVESNPHILILDEPTNHLDLPSVVCLEDALEGFEAALVMVSHDQRFLDALTNRRWSIEPGEGQRWILRE
jgi:macrolide transport system ATP-binding/permease protein